MSEPKYTAPMLVKRVALPPIHIWCEHCQTRADGYIIYEGDPAKGEPPQIMNIWCHGDGIRWAVEDVEGFHEMLAKHRVGEPGYTPLKVFAVPENKPLEPPQVKDTLL